MCCEICVSEKNMGEGSGSLWERGGRRQMHNVVVAAVRAFNSEPRGFRMLNPSSWVDSCPIKYSGFVTLWRLYRR